MEMSDFAEGDEGEEEEEEEEEEDDDGSGPGFGDRIDEALDSTDAVMIASLLEEAKSAGFFHPGMPVLQAKLEELRAQAPPSPKPAVLKLEGVAPALPEGVPPVSAAGQEPEDLPAIDYPPLGLKDITEGCILRVVASSLPLFMDASSSEKACDLMRNEVIKVVVVEESVKDIHFQGLRGWCSLSSADESTNLLTLVSPPEPGSQEDVKGSSIYRVVQVGFSPPFLRFSIGKCRNCPFFRAFY